MSLGMARVDGADPRVESCRPVAVPAVGAVRGDLAVSGVAQHLDLRRHQALGEAPHDLFEQVVAVLLEMLAQPLERVHGCRDCHRVFLLMSDLQGLHECKVFMRLTRWSSLRGMVA
jgi:hypothetical protein